MGEFLGILFSLQCNRPPRSNSRDPVLNAVRVRRESIYLLRHLDRNESGPEQVKDELWADLYSQAFLNTSLLPDPFLLSTARSTSPFDFISLCLILRDAVKHVVMPRAVKV